MRAASVEYMLTPMLIGFGTGLSLIAAIGAQNAFVLRQGILRQHVLVVVLICGLTDAVLETLGVAGIGFVIERAPLVLEVIRWGGVVFLVWYAWGAARRAMHPGVLIAAPVAAGIDSEALATNASDEFGAAETTDAASASGESEALGSHVAPAATTTLSPHAAHTPAPAGKSSLRATVLACLAITYLNPHVYLDTMVLMGSVGNAQGDPERWWFALGGGLASIIWFAAIGYGARALSRFFATPRSWQILDWIIVVIMLVIAARLAFGGIGV